MKTLSKYGILIVVSNRLYLVLVIGLHTRYGVQIPIYLERGRKPLHLLNLNTRAIKVQLPIYLARGRKRSRCWFSWDFWFLYRYLPREGPETNLINLLFSMFLYSHQLTSRGAGNAVIDSVQIIEFSIATYLPREGPETVIERIEWIVVCCVQILIYLARGREQKSTVISIRPREIVQLPIHLERGRKRTESLIFIRFKHCIDTYLPREGPETYSDCQPLL